MSLLPSRGPETSSRQDGEFEVVGVDEDVAPVLDALSSETARDVLNAIYDQPGTPSEIADRLDMSIQKVAYHLENLEDVDLIAVAGTRYSEKGQEMTVYEPPDDPLVLFVGTEERKSRLRSLVRRVVPTVAALGLGSLLVQRLFGGDDPILATGPGGDGGDDAVAYDINNQAPENPQLSGPDASTPTPETAATSTPQTAATATPQPAATSTPAGTDVSTVVSTTGESTSRADPTTIDLTAADNLTTLDPTTATDTASSILEPGLAFFLGGAFVLSLVAVWWYARAR